MKTILSAIFVLAFAPCAFAALGDDEGKVSESSQIQPKSVRSGLVMHEQIAHHVTVHQFAEPQGKVFAVSWAGPVHPDLRELLGAHYAHYKSSFEKNFRKTRGRRFVEYEDDGLHVEMGGHMGSVRGRVWLTSIFPKQVSHEDIH